MNNVTRILVCEDDLAARILVCIMVSRAGYEAIRCKGAFAALALLGDDTFALLITALELEDMDGIGLIQRVRSLADTHNMPVLLMLERKDTRLLKTAIDAGATDFVIKPLMYHPFIEQVKRLLG